MIIQLTPSKITEKSVLRNLMELCNYDFTEFDPVDVNEHGLYEYDYLDNYWTEEGRYPFIVRVNDRLAGFVLVGTINIDEIKVYSIAEFFIMKKYRRKGIGKEVAFKVFDFLPGFWEVAQMEENIPAQIFWRKIISEYTNNYYEETRKDNWNGPVQRFKTNQ